MGYFITFSLLAFLWLLFSGLFDALHLALGLISCLLLTALLQPTLVAGGYGRHEARILLRLLLYVPRLSLRIARANLNIVYLTLHPGLPINPQSVTVETALCTDMGKTIMGNAITLQPGTVTVRIDADLFTVHALSDRHARDLLDDGLLNDVREMERE